MPEDLATALRAAAPHLGRLGSSVTYFPVIGSTNDVAAALAAAGACEGAVVVADEQTAGRGRRGRQWFSPPGSGLYVSVVLAPGRSGDEDGRATSLLTLTAGVGLSESLEAATGLVVDVKWPNDLYIGRRKLGGILAEASGGEFASQAVVVGFGINVEPAAYPPELGDRATSLASELGRPVDRAPVFAAALAGLARRYEDLIARRFDAILDAWRARAPSSVGARVTWQGGAGLESGITAGIDQSGALLVEAGGRVERVVAGEVIWV